jgi:hypothetical protein
MPLMRKGIETIVVPSLCRHLKPKNNLRLIGAWVSQSRAAHMNAITHLAQLVTTYTYRRFYQHYNLTGN